MKEYCQKFSIEQDGEPSESRRNEPDPALPQRPVAQDLRFVVKESLNLGLRFITEIEQMLKKITE
ncbi:MAG: hypothetical protein HGB29_03460 [Chlorobiaceae bacterium]|nr:hypothetical protein [Chlorobiaceae bacterium]NTW73900.1 hypothetical protein [Chlorobiaceae bacterium]